MTWYAHVRDVPAPVEVYDAVHAELLRRTGGQVDGLVLHVCRETGTGFQVVEVWTDRAACERADRELVGPILAGLGGDGPGPQPPPPQEFTVRGIVVPAGDVAM
ncbi:hypothetical protein WHI96_25995 [Pseudonocardia tropica]|uniref:ABM domain-containing protein n=1 Tax=Pseudonocardia tropica TaxID=681289 RepID=A0ABV1K246_9PSEU